MALSQILVGSLGTKRERGQSQALCLASCETRRWVCTQTLACTNKPNLAKNSRKGNRCFQLKRQRLPRSRVLMRCGCCGPRTTGRDHIWKPVCITPCPTCHVRRRHDLAISMLAVSGVQYGDAGKNQEAVRQGYCSHCVLWEMRDPGAVPGSVALWASLPLCFFPLCVRLLVLFNIVIKGYQFTEIQMSGSLSGKRLSEGCMWGNKESTRLLCLSGRRDDDQWGLRL